MTSLDKSKKRPVQIFLNYLFSIIYVGWFRWLCKFAVPIRLEFTKNICILFDPEFLWISDYTFDVL